MKQESMNEFGVYWGCCESCGHCERLKGLSKTMSYGECPRCHQQAFNEDFKADPERTVHIEDEVEV